MIKLTELQQRELDDLALYHREHLAQDELTRCLGAYWGSRGKAVSHKDLDKTPSDLWEDYLKDSKALLEAYLRDELGIKDLDCKPRVVFVTEDGVEVPCYYEDGVFYPVGGDMTPENITHIPDGYGGGRS